MIKAEKMWDISEVITCQLMTSEISHLTVYWDVSERDGMIASRKAEKRVKY